MYSVCASTCQFTYLCSRNDGFLTLNGNVISDSILYSTVSHSGNLRMICKTFSHIRRIDAAIDDAKGAQMQIVCAWAGNGAVCDEFVLMEEVFNDWPLIRKLVKTTRREQPTPWSVMASIAFRKEAYAFIMRLVVRKFLKPLVVSKLREG